MLDVILCSYNSEDTIKDCVDSILNQTFRLFHLYIFDDCSTDKTVEILKTYKDRRITVVSSKKNIGTYAGKNFILKNYCKSPFVALHDSDDISDPNRFRRQIKYIVNNDIHCVGTCVKEFWDDPELQPHTVSSATSENNERINTYPEVINKQQLQELGSFLNEEKYEKYLKFKFCMNGTVMFDRKLLQKLGGWDGRTRIAADTDIFIRTLSFSDIHNIQEPLYNRRFHKNSLTASGTCGIKSKVRKDYNMARRLVIESVLNNNPVTRDFYYPKFKREIIKCAA
tara:strand:+ start:845 stop:1693 length:849 start_codon:yes stop_codon:yes gene_type:complete